MPNTAGRIRGPRGNIGLRRYMNMSSASDVVSRKLGEKLNHPILTGDLNSSQTSFIIRGAVFPLVPSVQKLRGIWVNASQGRVRSSSIAVPGDEGGALQWLTCFKVDDANVEVKADSFLGLAEMVPDHLSIDTADIRRLLCDRIQSALPIRTPNRI